MMAEGFVHTLWLYTLLPFQRTERQRSEFIWLQLPQTWYQVGLMLSIWSWSVHYFCFSVCIEWRVVCPVWPERWMTSFWPKWQHKVIEGESSRIGNTQNCCCFTEICFHELVKAKMELKKKKVSLLDFASWPETWGQIKANTIPYAASLSRLWNRFFFLHITGPEDKLLCATIYLDLWEMREREKGTTKHRYLRPAEWESDATSPSWINVSVFNYTFPKTSRE